MERKIGFAPISHSGKECVLRVELLPHNINLERKIGFTPISHSGKECVLRVELLPHNNLEAATGFEPVIKVLQTSALPLGYAANNWASWIRTSA